MKTHEGVEVQLHTFFTFAITPRYHRNLSNGLGGEKRGQTRPPDYAHILCEQYTKM